MRSGGWEICSVCVIVDTLEAIMNVEMKRCSKEPQIVMNLVFSLCRRWRAAKTMEDIEMECMRKGTGMVDRYLWIKIGVVLKDNAGLSSNCLPQQGYHT